jgi:uncharacterized protein (TIGR03083 family)
MARARLQPQEALLEQSRTILEWIYGLAPEAFERPTVLPDWSVRQLAGHLVVVLDGLRQSLDQPIKEPALPIHEYVSRYRRDVEMIMTTTLEASAGLTGPEVVKRLESAIDDLTVRLEAGVRMSQVINARRGPTTIEDHIATRIIELVVHTDDLNRSLPRWRRRSCIGVPFRAVPVHSPEFWRGSSRAVPWRSECRRTPQCSARSVIPGQPIPAEPHQTSWRQTR